MEKNYWRGTLTKSEQLLYDRMTDAFYRYQEQVPCAAVDFDRLDEIYGAVLDDHPELYYLPTGVELRKTTGFFVKREEVVIQNLFGRAQISAYDRELEKIKSELLARLRFCKNDFEREKRVCEFLIERTTYKLDNTYNQNAATVLIKGVGQCSGIARAAKLLFDWCGVKSIVVSGSAKDRNKGREESHSWNIVEIGGRCYHLDVTFMLGWNTSKKKPYKFVYFNYTDDEMKNTHKWDMSLAPRCNAFYADKELLLSASVSPEKTVSASSTFQLSKLLENAILSGEKELVFEYKIAMPAKDLMELVQTVCQKVANKTAFRGSVSIQIQGNLVRIELRA